MKKFLDYIKNLPNGTIKKVVTSLIGLLVSGVMLVTSGIVFGWFADSSRVTAGGMQLAVSTGNFEIWVDRPSPSEYERTVLGRYFYNWIEEFKGYLNGEGNSTTRDTTDTMNVGLSMELVNETVNTDDDKHLRPGSYGTFSFYVVPKSDQADLNLTFSLDVKGFVVETETVIDDVTGESELAVSSIHQYNGVDAEALNNLLKGHLLFFTSRTTQAGTDVYSGLVKNGVYNLSVTSSDWTTDVENDMTYYRVTLYWIWPLTLREMLNADKYPPTGAGTDSSLKEYISDNPDYFFLFKSNAEQNEEIGTYSEQNEGLDFSDLTKLSDGYDDGDQLIGDKLEYLAVYISIFDH